MIQEPARVMGAVSSLEHVKVVTPRLEFSGLLSNGETTVSFIGQGIDPEAENEISTLFLMDDGQKLSGGDDYQIIIGRGLARGVGSKSGDPLILLTNTTGGSINALDVNLKGIFFTTSKEFDDRAVRMPIKTAQKLLHTDEVQSLVVLLDDTSATDSVRSRIDAFIEKEGLGLETRAWYELADFYTKTVELYKRQFFVIKLIIGIVVILSVFNTMNMSVLERLGEVGTIMALGTKRGGVIAMFVSEGLALGVLGGIIGLTGGYLLATLISYIGIPMPPPPGTTTYWTAKIAIVPGVFAFSFLLAVVTSVLSSIYPAIKASRLEIADALRHNI
jgi:putative ABC transport system permease protein